MTQGYLTIAFGAEKYYEMAANLARSVKLKDPKRPICLLHDNGPGLKKVSELFDDVVFMDSDPSFVGCANKLRVYDYTPYDETMFIDADCLLVKSDMDRHWSKMGDQCFGYYGKSSTSGIYGNYQIDLSKACKKLEIPYFVTGNSGVFYFKKTVEGKVFFETAKVLFEDKALRPSHGKVEGQIADEPAFGAAMGRLNLKPVKYSDGDGCIMIATWRSRRVSADLVSEISHIEKPLGKFLIAKRFFPSGWEVHSPSIMHFIGLKPKGLYQKLLTQLDNAEA